MRSVRTQEFRKRYDSLSADIRTKALKSFVNWKNDSSHPGLFFKLVDSEVNMWSVRVDLDYRALCMKTVLDGETMYVWFWIGPHDEYERLIG